VGPHPVDGLDERQLVEQVGLEQRDAAEQVLDAPVVGRAEAPDDASDLVPLLEQEFGEIRAVLASDAGYERAFLHGLVRGLRAREL